MSKITVLCTTIAALLALTAAIPVKELQKISPSLGKNGRIIGGTPATSSQFPFMVAISVSKSDGRYFCSGTLWGNQWVVTAGQCVEGANQFTLQFGSHYLTTEDSNRKIASTFNYVLHDQYDPMTLDNDIGLIKLRLGIDHTDYIKSVDKFPDVDLDLEYVLAFTAVGWGQTSDSEADLSEDLQFVNIVSIPNSECKIFYGDQITDNMICVAGNNNEGACTGDTGSPLIAYVRPNWIVQYGVSSFHSQNGCETPDPSGYTRTFPYKDWIQNTTGRVGV